MSETPAAALWQPNPEWSPEVQRFVTGLAAYLLTLPPDEQRLLLQDIALLMMKGADE